MATSRSKARKRAPSRKSSATAPTLGEIALFRPAFDLLATAEQRPSPQELALIGTAIWSLLEREHHGHHHRQWIAAARAENLRR